jgi:hypothetical protein
MKPALIIIYNHRFDKNIEVVERIYKDRFSRIFHLMPFYDGNKENVIAVYDNSFCFQGYVAQGFKHFYKKEYAHYLFIADDMILNPEINENNYAEHFCLESESSFIPELRNVPRPDCHWHHDRDALHFNPFNRKNFNTKGIEIANLLPSPKDAAAIMEKFGIKNSKVSFNQVYGNIFKKFLFKTRLIIEDIFVYFHFYPYKTHYPLASSYSDIFVIDKNTIDKFSQYCGMFAASRLFAEIAIPTALALSANKIVTGKSVSKHTQKFAAFNSEIQLFLDKCSFDLSILLRRFPQNEMYIHPVKLSKWNTENI